MRKKYCAIGLALIFLLSQAAFLHAANDEKWINPLTKRSGLTIAAPGLKLTEHADAPTHADLADGVIYADTDDNLYYRAGGAWVDLTVQGAASLTLDGAFDNGKIINGANSSANAVQIGDGTDAILFHTEAAGDVRMTTNGTSDLTIAPDGGDTDVTGTLDVSGAVGIDGDFDINTNKFTVAASSGNTLVAGTLNVTGASTLGGATSVTGGLTVDTFTLSSGGITISSGGLTVVGDNIFTAAATTGNGNYFDGTTVTSGDVLQIEYDATNLNTGKALNITEDTATVFEVAEDGNTTIAGTAAGTTALGITAGDLVLTSGRADINGDAGSADLLDIIRSNTASAGDGIDIDMGSAAQAGDGIDIAWAGAGTGDALTVNMANNVAGAALNIAASGARTGPIIDIANAGTDSGTDDHVVNILQSGSQDSDIVRLAFGTANSPGDALSIDMDTNLGGQAIYVDEGGLARTGAALHVKGDGTGTHSLINLDMEANAAITGLDITADYNGSPAGDAIKITLTDSDALDTGLLNFSVGTGNRGALIKYTSTGTDSGTTSHVMDFNQTGVLDSNVIDITYDTNASTGQAIQLNMGSNVAGMALAIVSAATGVADEGSGIDIAATGALVQGANVLRIDSAGNMAHADTRVFEINETGANQADSYMADFNSTNNGGLAISVPAADNALLIEQGLVSLGGGGALFADDGSFTLTGGARETKTIWIPAQSFQNHSGAAAGLVGLVGVWQLSDAASDAVTATFYVPSNYVEGTDMTCKVHWSSAEATNTAVWDGTSLAVVAGEDTSAAGNLFTQENDAANGTADYLNVTEGFTIGNANIDKGDQVILQILRLGNDGSDNLTDDADFQGVAITYTADRI